MKYVSQNLRRNTYGHELRVGDSEGDYGFSALVHFAFGPPGLHREQVYLFDPGTSVSRTTKHEYVYVSD